MQNFFKKTLYFSAGFLFIFVLLSFLYSFRVSSRDNFYELLRRFDDPKVQPKVLILGDSRPAFAIKHKFLSPDVYNFSYPSETYREMLLKAEYAIRIKQNVRYIIIPIDYHMLSYFYDNHKDATHIYPISGIRRIKFAYEFSWKETMKSFVNAYIPLTSPAERTTLVAVLKKDVVAYLSGEENKRTIFITQYGDLAPVKDEQWRDFSDTAKHVRTERRIADHLLSGPVVEPEMIEALDKLLYFARDRNIKIIAVRYPITSQYEQRAREAGIDGVEKVFQERAGRFALVLNYANVFRSREGEFFQDADHLNSKGAEEFTKMFVANIKGMLK